MSQLNVNTITNEAGTGSPDFTSGLKVGGTSYPSVGPLSNRNMLINGAMQVWQRGTSVNAGIDAFQYAADRFWIYALNGSGSIGQSTDAPSGFAYSIHNNSNSECSFGSNVELTRQGFAAPFALNQFITLSFFVKGASAGSGTFDFSYRDVSTGGAGTLVIASAQNRVFSYTTEWSRVTIPVQIDVTPSANNRMLQAEFAMPAGMRVTGVQLEAGDTATPFEHRSFGQELALCQRYYQTIGEVNGNYVLSDSFLNGAARTALPTFITTMRAAPSVVVRNYDNGTSGQLREFSSGTVRTISGVFAVGVFGGGYIQSTTNLANPFILVAEYSAEL